MSCGGRVLEPVCQEDTGTQGSRLGAGSATELLSPGALGGGGRREGCSGGSQRLSLLS